MRQADVSAIILPMLRRRLCDAGFKIVPIEPPESIGTARDECGDLIFAGGTGHYFRNDTEALW